MEAPKPNPAQSRIFWSLLGLAAVVTVLIIANRAPFPLRFSPGVQHGAPESVDSYEFAVLGAPTTPSVASLRESAKACDNTDWSFFDGIVLKPPLRNCSVAELASAIGNAYRVGNATWGLHRGSPLVIDGCRLEWFIGARVCDLLQKAGGVYLIGDSIMRHLHQTMRALAIGDLDRGLGKHLGETGRDKWWSWQTCRCDNAYDDGHARWQSGESFMSEKNKFCRENTLAMLNLTEVRGSSPDLCPAWGAVDYLPPHIFATEGEDRRSRISGITVKNGGLHTLDGEPTPSTRALDHYFGAPQGNTSYIYCLLSAPGSNKKPSYLLDLGTPQTLAYNELVRARAAMHNATVLDVYALTVNTPSIDGVHYFMAVNVDLAQVLLNLIAAILREKGEGSLVK